MQIQHLLIYKKGMLAVLRGNINESQLERYNGILAGHAEDSCDVQSTSTLSVEIGDGIHSALGDLYGQLSRLEQHTEAARLNPLIKFIVDAQNGLHPLLLAISTKRISHYINSDHRTFNSETFPQFFLTLQLMLQLGRVIRNLSIYLDAKPEAEAAAFNLFIERMSGIQEDLKDTFSQDVAHLIFPEKTQDEQRFITNGFEQLQKLLLEVIEYIPSNTDEDNNMIDSNTLKKAASFLFDNSFSRRLQVALVRNFHSWNDFGTAEATAATADQATDQATASENAGSQTMDTAGNEESHSSSGSASNASSRRASAERLTESTHSLAPTASNRSSIASNSANSSAAPSRRASTELNDADQGTAVPANKQSTEQKEAAKSPAATPVNNERKQPTPNATEYMAQLLKVLELQRTRLETIAKKMKAQSGRLKRANAKIAALTTQIDSIKAVVKLPYSFINLEKTYFNDAKAVLKTRRGSGLFFFRQTTGRKALSKVFTSKGELRAPRVK